MLRGQKFNYLIADDEFPIVKIISDILAIHPSTNAVYTANDGERALHLYRNNKIDIVITDILMPRLSGIDLIKQLREASTDPHIIVVSAFSNIDLVREAIRNGAYDYIIKPFSVDEILFSINRIIDRLKLLEERKNYVVSLEKKIEEVTLGLENSFFDSLTAILKALEARHSSTLEHSRRVADYAGRLAQVLNLQDIELAGIRMGAMLHDIGKIGIPDAILFKTEPLTEEDWDVIRTHPAIGRNIVEPVLNKNKIVLDTIYYHHERWDGSGYPEKMAGPKIPLGARIAMLANAYVAMVSGSHYKAAKTVAEAVAELRACAGSQLDPELTTLFIDKVLNTEGAG